MGFTSIAMMFQLTMIKIYFLFFIFMCGNALKPHHTFRRRAFREARNARNVETDWNPRMLYFNPGGNDMDYQLKGLKNPRGFGHGWYIKSVYGDSHFFEKRR